MQDSNWGESHTFSNLLPFFCLLFLLMSDCCLTVYLTNKIAKGNYSHIPAWRLIKRVSVAEKRIMEGV